TNNDGNGDVCCQASTEVFDGKKYHDKTLFGTTCFAIFFSSGYPHRKRCRGQRTVYKRCKVDHLVVIGLGGFQLCTFLQDIRRVSECRQILVALVTKLGRASEFK
ncbi:unnamed protein product, partial [Ectocarpus sp. 12 AP-2014]